ncbi:MAG: YccF domain-containing protein [Methylomonas sp.]|jgi:uncharacterized membrane protein YccF (DUF307 family)
MRLIGNIIWFLFGGLFMGLAWWLAGVMAFLTIVGIPWARSCFVIGTFSFFPFGKEAISRKELYGEDDLGTGFLGSIGNVIWFLLAGIWLAIGHIMSAVMNCLTIIGIPFAVQHIKLAAIALAPVGKTVVTVEVAEAARKANAEAIVAAGRK